MDIKGLSSDVISKINQYPVNTSIAKKNQFPILFTRIAKKKKQPKTFDARKKWGKLITEPLKQFCGSCWAFASTMMLNDRYNIYYNTNKDKLSIDHLFECNYLSVNEKKKIQQVVSQESDFQCHGDYLISAFYYFFFIGTTTQLCNMSNPVSIIENSYYPEYGKKTQACYSNFDINQNYCGFSVIKNGIVYGKAFEKIKGLFPFNFKNVQAIEEDIVLHGPVATTFECYSDFWTYDSKNKIYKKSADAQLVGGHAVVIVGWGDDYWICRNSWGKDWGDQGYFRFAKGIDECGIESNCLSCYIRGVYSNNLQLYFTEMFEKNKQVALDFYKLGKHLNEKTDQEVFANDYKVNYDFNQSILICSLLNCKNGQIPTFSNYSLNALRALPGVQINTTSEQQNRYYISLLGLQLIIGICILLIILLLKYICS